MYIIFEINENIYFVEKNEVSEKFKSSFNRYVKSEILYFDLKTKETKKIKFDEKIMIKEVKTLKKEYINGDEILVTLMFSCYSETILSKGYEDLKKILSYFDIEKIKLEKVETKEARRTFHLLIDNKKFLLESERWYRNLRYEKTSFDIEKSSDSSYKFLLYISKIFKLKNKLVIKKDDTLMKISKNLLRRVTEDKSAFYHSSREFEDLIDMKEELKKQNIEAEVLDCMLQKIFNIHIDRYNKKIDDYKEKIKKIRVDHFEMVKVFKKQGIDLAEILKPENLDLIYQHKINKSNLSYYDSEIKKEESEKEGFLKKYQSI